MKYENKMIKILGEDVFYKAMAEYYINGRSDSFIEYCRENKRQSLLGAFTWICSKDGHYYWYKLNKKLRGGIWITKTTTNQL